MGVGRTEDIQLEGRRLSIFFFQLGLAVNIQVATLPAFACRYTLAERIRVPNERWGEWEVCDALPRPLGTALGPMASRPTNHRSVAVLVFFIYALFFVPLWVVLPAMNEFIIARRCLALHGVSQGTVCGGADDYYYYSPWRAPYAAGRLQRATTCGVAFPLHGISLCARPAAQYP